MHEYNGLLVTVVGEMHGGCLVQVRFIDGTDTWVPSDRLESVSVNPAPDAGVDSGR